MQSRVQSRERCFDQSLLEPDAQLGFRAVFTRVNACVVTGLEQLTVRPVTAAPCSVFSVQSAAIMVARALRSTTDDGADPSPPFTGHPAARPAARGPGVGYDVRL